jgi:branched-chain amino acid aminotransferase
VQKIEVNRTREPAEKPEGPLGFGRLFTDHMFRMDYSEDEGWHAARIEPRKPLSLDPAASVLHYAQAVFEGLKAFKGQDGQVRLFRPDRHASRFARSFQKMCIPALLDGMFRRAVMGLVAVEQSWVPSSEGASLYIRPLVIATEPFLGVRPSSTYTFLVMCSPVGAYYARGFEPVRIWVEREEVRAVRGGTGAAKTAGNYAASLHAAKLAKERGYDQVLWTDAVNHNAIEEVGTMNVFAHVGDEIITPPLRGAILPGVTRESVIRLMRDEGRRVVERQVTIDELRDAYASEKLHEMFGTGTAAVVSPIGELGFSDEDLIIGDGRPGTLAKSLFSKITAIQRGAAEDPHGWMYPLDPE